MLFDLRGAGRRRTVKAIYLSLAVLMGGGLVLFGVGGNVGGGLLDAIKSNGGGGSTTNTFEKRVHRLERQVRLHPQDQGAWLELARSRYLAATSGENYDQATGSFTPKGKVALRAVKQAWDRYLALNPKSPDPNVANLMVQAFGPRGLGQLDAAVSAMEIYVAARPKSSALYGQLAALAYAAGQTRTGDLSAAKAVALAPKAQRATLRQELDGIKTQAASAAVQQASGAAATTTTTP